MPLSVHTVLAAGSLPHSKLKQVRATWTKTLKRLGLLENVVADVRVQASAVTALMPTFATKSDLLETKGELKEDIHGVRLEVQTLRTETQSLKTELKGDADALRADMGAMEARLIRWFVGTAIAIAALAFTAAKYVH